MVCHVDGMIGQERLRGAEHARIAVRPAARTSLHLDDEIDGTEDGTYDELHNRAATHLPPRRLERIFQSTRDEAHAWSPSQRMRTRATWGHLWGRVGGVRWGYARGRIRQRAAHAESSGTQGDRRRPISSRSRSQLQPIAMSGRAFEPRISPQRPPTRMWRSRIRGGGRP
jgi:hypothetical protein